jgi:Flp pilus assembly protein TadG
MTARLGGRGRTDSGAAAAILVLLAGALLAAGGLVLDGGRAIAGRQHAADVAEQAARAGANALDISTLRTDGVDRLDPAAARRDACQLAAAADVDGCHARVHGDSITVSITNHTPTVLLGLVGINHFSTTSRASARPATGIVTVEERQ